MKRVEGRKGAGNGRARKDRQESGRRDSSLGSGVGWDVCEEVSLVVRDLLGGAGRRPGGKRSYCRPRTRPYISVARMRTVRFLSTAIALAR
jgi:hypothetical protein